MSWRGAALGPEAAGLHPARPVCLSLGYAGLGILVVPGLRRIEDSAGDRLQPFLPGVCCPDRAGQDRVEGGSVPLFLIKKFPFYLVVLSSLLLPLL